MQEAENYGNREPSGLIWSRGSHEQIYMWLYNSRKYQHLPKEGIAVSWREGGGFIES